MTRHAALALALLGLLFFPSGDTAARDRCDAPPELTGAVAPLPATAKRAREQAPVHILAVGTASMAAGSRGLAPYIGRLDTLLEPVLGHRPTLTWKAVRGGLASETIEVVFASILERRPDLVIWQSGTVDAVRNIDPAAFGAALEAGIERLEAAKIDLILVDMQFARFSRATIDYGPYQDAIALQGVAHDVNLFRRYDLMRHWADEGQIDVERAGPSGQGSEQDWLHACLAKQLAKLIQGGIALASPP